MITLRSLTCCGGSNVTDPVEEPPQDVIVENKSTKSKQAADGFEKPRATKTKPKTEVQEHVVSLVQSARHFEAEIAPKSDAHLCFLKSCAGYDGTAKYGKVHANLDSKFWPWLEKLDPAEVRQAYIDAVMLTGEQPTNAARCAKIIAESGNGGNLGPEDFAKMNTLQKNALIALKLFHTEEVERRKKPLHLPGVQMGVSLKRAYKKAVGGDMKSDYRLYLRSIEFSDKLKAAGLINSPKEKQAAIYGMIATQKDGGKALVIALRRLELLREAPVAGAN